MLCCAVLYCCVQEDNKHSVDVAFLVTRVLLFVCVNAQLRLHFEQQRLLPILVTALLTHTASPAALASTRPSSTVSSPTASPHRQASSLLPPALQRQFVAELIKLICHLCMDDQGSSLQQAVSEEQFQESVQHWTHRYSSSLLLQLSGRCRSSGVSPWLMSVLVVAPYVCVPNHLGLVSALSPSSV